MKALLIALCVAGLLFMAGCSDTANIDASDFANNGAGGDSMGGNGGNGNGGGGNVGNLQTLVTDNCNLEADGDAIAINGRSFSPDDTTDPVQSVFTRNCLTDVN